MIIKSFKKKNIMATNSNPIATSSDPIADQTADTKALFEFDISSQFSDPDNDVLTYVASLTAGGGALPSWLGFDANTGVFTGTPKKEDVAAGINISVLARDPGGKVAINTFDLTVAHSNEEPVLAVPFDAQSDDPSDNVLFSFDTSTAFSDPDFDVLTYSAYIDSEATGAVSTVTLSGALNALDTMTIVIDSTATPVLSIFVDGSADPYTTPALLAAAFAEKPAAGYTLTASADLLVIASDAKGDAVAALTPTYSLAATIGGGAATGTTSANLSNNLPGKSLPSWLTMGEVGAISTLTLSGALNTLHSASIAIDGAVTVTVDGSTGAYTTPALLAEAFATQTAAGYTLTASGDELIITSVVRGASVPALNPVFSVAATAGGPATGAPTSTADNQPGKLLSGLLVGTPTVADTGTYLVKITATDPLALFAEASFYLSVLEDVNVAPFIDTSTADQVVNTAIDSLFSLDLGAAFKDSDGDVLSYSLVIDSHSFTSIFDLLSLGDGLPSWLSFDKSTGVLSGNTKYAVAGEINYQVTAEDPLGEKVTDNFTLQMKNLVEYPVNSTVAGSQSQAVVTSKSAGGYLITWLADSADSFYGQSFSDAGINVGSEFLVDETTSNRTDKASSVTLAGGTQVQVSSVNSSDGGFDIQAQLFAAGGQSIGAAFQVNADSALSHYAPTVAALTGGGFVVSWHGQSVYNGYDIFAQRFNVNGEMTGFHSISGSELTDEITGTDLDDSILCFEANDVVNSSKGNDLIDGGVGVDTCVYAEEKALFTLTNNSSQQWQITQGTMTDTLMGMERVHFSDSKVALDLEGNAGFVAKTMGAIFGSDIVTNKAYIGAGLSLLEDHGISNNQWIDIVLTFAGYTEAGYGSVDKANSSLLATLFMNGFGMSIPAELSASLVTGLNEGAFTVVDAVNVVAEQDYNKTQIGLVGLTSTGIEYL